MANMSSGDRGSFERATIGNETSFRPRDGSSRGQTVYFVIALVILVVLGVAAIQVFEGWAHLVVIADVILVVGCIAVFMQGRREQRHEATPATGDQGWRPW